MSSPKIRPVLEIQAASINPRDLDGSALALEVLQYPGFQSWDNPEETMGFWPWFWPFKIGISCKSSKTSNSMSIAYGKRLQKMMENHHFEWVNQRTEWPCKK